jgi:hypothetical protein
MDNFLVQKFLSVDLCGLMLTFGSLRSFWTCAGAEVNAKLSETRRAKLMDLKKREAQHGAEMRTNKKRPSTGHDRTIEM